MKIVSCCLLVVFVFVVVFSVLEEFVSRVDCLKFIEGCCSHQEVSWEGRSPGLDPGRRREVQVQAPHGLTEEEDELQRLLGPDVGRGRLHLTFLQG